tara:strand:- start:551 stop:1336 length:786 start_codon:yes stop_codon:yes gene_type:complete
MKNVFEYMDTNRDNIKHKITTNFDYTNDVAEKLVDDLGNLCLIESGGEGTVPIGSISKEVESELLMKDYKLKIKSGENFHNKLNSIEIKVFQNLYGDTWNSYYKKWINERNKYVSEKKMDNCKTFMDEYSIINTEDINEIDEEIKTKIRTLEYLENINSFNNIIKDNNETSDIYKRKIQYRDIEQSKLEFYNKLMNWIYYILLFGLFLNTQGNLYSKGLYYILLILLPIVIYPYIFNIMKYLSLQLVQLKRDSFPKNAFME